METEKRIKLIEEAIVVMKNLFVNHDERLENYHKSLETERQERRESREDFEFKFNALIDAQMRNETAITELRKTAESTLKRVEKLENKN